jgi:hypothetical protein
MPAEVRDGVERANEPTQKHERRLSRAWTAFGSGGDVLEPREVSDVTKEYAGSRKPQAARPALFAQVFAQGNR